MSYTTKYAVIETAQDGTLSVWGPFSDHRAQIAADALLSQGAESAVVTPIFPSAQLDRWLPDWKRDVRV